MASVRDGPGLAQLIRVVGIIRGLTIGMLAAPPALAQQRIADNSFLIEEAYNQEAGVVQHISTLQLQRGGEWAYSFTQEWPFFGQRHQLSYTIPIARLQEIGASTTNLGDLALNYRLQLLNRPDGLAISPRATLLIPTGDRATGHGSGKVGFQLNLPVSIPVGSRLVAHLNSGVTRTEVTTGFLGGSAIVLVSPTFNLMVEAGWEDFETGFLNPGFRFAINTRGGLQIVPGAAYTVQLDGPDGVFLYLSFEHPFRHTASD